MIERRKPKKTDQQQVEKGFLLIKQLMEKHPEIEPTLWAGSVWSVLVDGYNQSGMSYEQFTKEWNEVKHHYKGWFDK